MKSVTKKFYLLYNFKDDDLNIRKTKPDTKEYPYSVVSKLKINYQVPDIDPEEIEIDFKVDKSEIEGITTELLNHRQAHKKVKTWTDQEAKEVFEFLELPPGKFDYVRSLTIRKDRAIIFNNFGDPETYVGDDKIKGLLNNGYLTNDEALQLFELFDKPVSKEDLKEKAKELFTNTEIRKQGGE